MHFKILPFLKFILNGMPVAEGFSAGDGVILFGGLS